MQERMARGGHGLPKVSLGPAMPYPSTPYGRATPETALQQPSSTPLDTPRHTPMPFRPASIRPHLIEFLNLVLIFSLFVLFCFRFPGEKEVLFDVVVPGGSHDQADAEWIVIRTHLWGHNDTPFGRPAPGQPSGRPGSCRRILYVLVTIN
jgi:hypothetical protein